MGLVRMEVVCGGGSARAASPVPGTAVALSAPLSICTIPKLMRLRCDRVAPFGRPVVPLVKRMTAGESSVMTGGAAPAPVGLGLGRQAVDQLHRHPGRHRVLIEAGHQALVPRDQDRAGQLDTEMQLRSRPPSVEAGDNRPQGHRGPHQQGVLGRVGRHDRHPVARLDLVPLGQQNRQRIDVSQRVAERPGAVGRGQEDEVTVVGTVPIRCFAQCPRPPGEDGLRASEHRLSRQLEGAAGSEQGAAGLSRKHLRPHPGEVRGGSASGFRHGLASWSVAPDIANSSELDPSFC